MRNSYEIIDDVVVIFVYNRGEYHECLVDVEDLDRLLELDVKWTGLAEGNSIYAIANVKDKSGKRTTMRMHRWLTGAEFGTVVDHKNHNGLDNRRSSNLEVVGKSENAQNLSKIRSDNTSGFRGVTWHKQRGKWAVQVRINGKHISGGLYDDLEEAAKAAECLMQEHLIFHTTVRSTGRRW